jgi:hypothetical protein
VNRLRVVGEILGAALYLAGHVPLALVYLLGSSLSGVVPGSYWGAIGAGYLAMVGLAIARPAFFKALSPRRIFDAWLLAAVPALVLSAILVQAQWPFTFPSWDGHGLGASGGEPNAAVFPWLHCGFWALLAWGWARGEESRNE